MNDRPISVATISTYGPTDYGVGHDIKTPGSLRNKRYLISTSRGASDFNDLLKCAVEQWDLRRGDKIIISIDKYEKSGDPHG